MNVKKRFSTGQPSAVRLAVQALASNGWPTAASTSASTDSASFKPGLPWLDLVPCQAMRAPHPDGQPAGVHSGQRFLAGPDRRRDGLTREPGNDSRPRPFANPQPQFQGSGCGRRRRRVKENRDGVCVFADARRGGNNSAAISLAGARSARRRLRRPGRAGRSGLKNPGRPPAASISSPIDSSRSVGQVLRGRASRRSRRSGRS